MRFCSREARSSILSSRVVERTCIFGLLQYEHTVRTLYGQWAGAPTREMAPQVDGGRETSEALQLNFHLPNQSVTSSLGMTLSVFRAIHGFCHALQHIENTQFIT